MADVVCEPTGLIRLKVHVVKEHVSAVLTENLVQFQLLSKESVSFPTEHPRFSRRISIQAAVP